VFDERAVQQRPMRFIRTSLYIPFPIRRVTRRRRRRRRSDEETRAHAFNQPTRTDPWRRTTGFGRAHSRISFHFVWNLKSAFQPPAKRGGAPPVDFEFKREVRRRARAFVRSRNKRQGARVPPRACVRREFPSFV